MAKKTTVNNEKYKAPALDKGLDVLNVLSSSDFGLTQMEIARALDRTVTEIFRMLVVLQRRGFIELDEKNDRYFITTKLFEWANRIPIVKRLTVAAKPIMKDLTNICHQSLHLCVKSDNGILIIAQVDNPGNDVLSTKTGSRIDFWRTSSGRVILSYKKTSYIEDFIVNYPHPDNLTKAEILADLATIRSNGYEVTSSFVIKGVTNICVPIFNDKGVAVAALTMPYIEKYFNDVTIKKCIKELMSATEILSKQIGGFNIEY